MLDAGLYIVATPIGNLGDISPRAVDVLQAADIIAAEDTRNAKKLFSLLGIPARKNFIAYEDHTEQDKFQTIADLIENGNSVALISDAGSPLISDPGYKLVRECRQRQLKVTALPGACAVICALQLSGLPTNRFMFAGFIPNKDKARIDLFTELKNINTTLVLYETAIANVRKKLQQNPIKGELVLVIAPPESPETNEPDISLLLAEEMKHSTLKESVKTIADKYHLKRNAVYEKALELKNKA